MPIDLGDIPTGTPPTAGEKLQIRSAIGVGQTDAPTFLAQTLTGQSLTGTQATSLVDLNATWNTTGNPSLIYGRVTNTNSGTTANLIDLGTFAGGSLFKVTKTGSLTAAGIISTPAQLSADDAIYAGGNGVRFGGLAWIRSAGYDGGFLLRNNAQTQNVGLAIDADNTLAQRNGTNAQAFRVYNTFPGTGNNEWGGFDWITTTNTLRIGTALSGSGVGRGVILAASGTGTTKIFGGSGSTISVQLMTGGGGSSLLDVSSGSADLTSNANLKFGTDNTYDIGANGANRPRNIYAATNIRGLTLQVDGGAGTGTFFSNAVGADGVVRISDFAGTSFGRLQLGGTTDAFPAIARDGAGIKFTGAAAGSTSWIKVPAVAVASLPAAATAGVGARSFVTDALTPVFGSAVTGGGAVTVPVYSTGSAWNVG